MKEKNMTRKTSVHIVVSGVVQGVFFRAHTQNAAQHFGLSGWVRNLRDGRVEIVAEGPHAALNQLVLWCQTGPPHARVDDVEATWGKATGKFESFEIRH